MWDYVLLRVQTLILKFVLSVIIFNSLKKHLKIAAKRAIMMIRET